MELDNVIDARRSCRSYQAGRGIADEQIRQIMKAALLAPSWKNTETGRYYVAKSGEAMDKVRASLAPYNQKSTANASAYVVTTFVGKVSGHSPEGQPSTELGDEWGAYDLGLQNAYLLLKARELGLDSLIMGMRDAGALREALDIPEDEVIVSVIALGYSDGEIALRPRKAFEEVCRIL